VSHADELLKAGDIAGARAQLIEQVRANPSDEKVRMFLFQLFAITGEWEKSKSQLEVLARLSPEARMLASVYNQCLAAEAERAAIIAGKRPAPFHHDVAWGADLAAALQAGGEGDFAGAEARRDAAFAAAPATPGTLDGEAFEWLADADARFGPCLEAIIAGNYGLMPLCALEGLEISAPVDLRDTVWAQAQFALRDGPRFAGFIPVRYPQSEASDDPQIVLGRSTEFSESDAGVIGHGHRLLTTSEGLDVPLLNIRTITFS
jgi:type VI secretion system protein ImpE